VSTRCTMKIERNYAVNDRSMRIDIKIRIPKFRSLSVSYHRPLSRREQAAFDWIHDQEMKHIQRQIDRLEEATK
jgi:hypothetical protein